VLGDVREGLRAQLDVGGHGDRAQAEWTEEAFREAPVIGKHQEDLVTASHSKAPEESSDPSRPIFELRVGERDVILLNRYFVGVEPDCLPEEVPEIVPLNEIDGLHPQTSHRSSLL
jgi:hypothetical protein